MNMLYELKTIKHVKTKNDLDLADRHLVHILLGSFPFWFAYFYFQSNFLRIWPSFLEFIGPQAQQINSNYMKLIN